MSIKLMHQVWELPLAPREKLVALVIADHANDDGIAWPSVVSIARKTGLSRRGVQMIIARLEQFGLITRKVLNHNQVHFHITPDRFQPVDNSARGCEATSQGCEATSQGCEATSHKPPKNHQEPSKNHHTARARACEGAAPVGASRGVCGDGVSGVMGVSLARPLVGTLKRIGIAQGAARTLAEEIVRRLDGERVAMLAGVIADRAERMERGDAPPITDPVRWVRTLMDRAGRGELSVPDEVAERVQSERVAEQVRAVLGAIEAGARVLLAGREAEVERHGGSTFLRVDGGVVPLGEAVARGIVRVAMPEESG